EDWYQGQEEIGPWVVLESLKAYITAYLERLGYTNECVQRSLTTGVSEGIKALSFSWGTFTAAVEAGICFSEAEKCAGSDYVTQFSYGLANGLLQQLNIPEM